MNEASYEAWKVHVPDGGLIQGQNSMTKFPGLQPTVRPTHVRSSSEPHLILTKLGGIDNQSVGIHVHWVAGAKEHESKA